MTKLNVDWFKAAGVRAIKTTAQAALGAIGGAVAFDDVGWAFVGMVALLAGATSLLTSLAGLPELKQ